MAEQPVSVIIPTYNYGRFLPDAIDSALRQSGPNLAVEVVVVDDGSTDDSAEIAARYGDRVRYIYQKNAGLSAGRNTGMREASHDLVVFLDADDMLVPGALASLLAGRERIAPRPAVVAARDRAVDVNGIFIGPPLQESENIIAITARLLVLRNQFGCFVLADRGVLLALGGFDTELRASEDRDMWIRVAARHPVVLLERCVALRRDHGTNMSRNPRRQTASIERVLAKAFANPDLHLSAGDRRLARAVCWYQSALMYAEAGERMNAARQMLRSILQCPLGPLKDAAVPPFSRLRGLAGIALSAIREVRRISPSFSR